MITIRRSQERGYADHGWLQTYHTFSFADYYDAQFTQFHSLRVLNEDRVKAGAGFSTHQHANMEILSYVLEGTLEHKDSLGTGSLIRKGDVQRMSAGTGVKHSEFNPSPHEAVHFLQIWFYPKQKDLAPSYEQKSFPLSERQNRLCLLASPDGKDQSVTIHQDVWVYGALLDTGHLIHHQFSSSKAAWLQVTQGIIEVNNHLLEAGDGVALENVSQLIIIAQKPAEFLLLELAT